MSDPTPARPTRDDAITRRHVLQHAATVGAAAAALGASAGVAAPPATGPAVTKGRVKQSLVSWCYQKHFGGVEGLCKAAKDLGVVSVELIDPQHWPTLKAHGLACAIAGSHGFVQGVNNPKYQAKCLDTIRKRIDECAAFGVPSVITFTGMREGIPDDVGMDNCVKAYKQVVGHAEQKGVTLCLEMLNSRVDFDMKGHPGYMGDHCDWCIELIKRVGSDRLKLLFDIYHVQIMDGDVIARVRQHKDHIGHVHTAGNPGRGELDDKQEINYRPILEALVDVGYKGYVGQEFIPTRDAMTGLREAVAICDV